MLVPVVSLSVAIIRARPMILEKVVSYFVLRLSHRVINFHMISP